MSSQSSWGSLTLLPRPDHSRTTLSPVGRDVEGRGSLGSSVRVREYQDTLDPLWVSSLKRVVGVTGSSRVDPGERGRVL